MMFNKKKFINTICSIFGLNYLRYSNKIEPTEYPIILSGEKVRCTKEYPLKEADVTLGNDYDVVEYLNVSKQATPFAKIPLDIVNIVNNKGDVVTVTMVFFERI